MAAPGRRDLPLCLLLLLLLALQVVARPEENREETESRGTVEEAKTGRLIESDIELIEPYVDASPRDIVLNNDRYWSPDCPDDFHKYWSASNMVSVCFHVSRTKLDWFGARDACERLAPSSSRCFSSLASVLNQDENDFIAGLLDRDHVWIGFHDRTSEGYFSWLDGRPYSFRFFYTGEPNNGHELASSRNPGEDCVELMYGYGNRWNDRSCTDLKYYACKAYCV